MAGCVQKWRTPDVHLWLVLILVYFFSFPILDIAPVFQIQRKVVVKTSGLPWLSQMRDSWGFVESVSPLVGSLAIISYDSRYPVAAKVIKDQSTVD